MKATKSKSHKMPEGEECLKSVTLDPATLRAIAERDLCEKPSTRKKALREMRDWVKSSTHFQNCRTDSSFLLRFLRMQKFQTQEAQTVLEKYIKMRTQHPSWFQNLDIRDPKLSELIGRGYIFALPMRDSKGRRVVFSRAAAMDASRFTAVDVMRAHFLTFEAMLEDEEVQINGLTYVFDEREVNWSHISVWTPSEVSKAFSCCERALPLRHREIHFVHLPWTMSLVFSFAKSLLSQKLRERFLTHSDFEHLWKVVPQNILPEECGGTIPMDDMIEKWVKELESKRPALTSLSKMKHGLYMTLSNSGLAASTSSLTSGASSSDESEDGSLDISVSQNRPQASSKLRRASEDRVLDVVGSLRKMEL